MKKKSVFFKTLIIILVIVAFVLGGFWYLKNANSDVELTSAEERWIKNNQSAVIDVYFTDELPLYSSNGEGVFLDFVSYFETNTELEFNKVFSEPEKEAYEFGIIDEDEGIVFGSDTFVFFRKEAEGLSKLDNLKSFRIGTLDYFENVFNNTDYNIAGYTKISDLTEALNSNEIDGILLPKNYFLGTAIENNYYFAYFLNDYKIYYGLKLNEEEDKLNSILEKKYNLWDNLERQFNKYVFDAFVDSLGISDVDKSNFRSIRYTYGYVENLPYEAYNGNEMIGINADYLNRFKDISGAEFNFVEYDSYADLKKAIDDGEVDLAFNYYNLDGTKLNAHVKNIYVVLSPLLAPTAFETLSMVDKKLYIVDNTYLIDLLGDTVDVTPLETIDDITDLRKNDDMLIVDKNIYDMYKNSLFSNCMVVYEKELLTDFGFVLFEKDETAVFEKIFNSYLNTINNDEELLIAKGNVIANGKSKSWSNIETFIYAIASVLVGYIFVKVLKRLLKLHSANKKLKKTEKLKFIDMLTSLKNRNYLNASITKWDENKIYPQAVVIVDLNNIKFINDTHGHDEGDKVIKKAASILINNQLENSDIVRTDGNEFLVYLIGKNEKEIGDYVRDLKKRFKTLPYGYGGACGYSMIEDDIKTLEDAINEATLDMRTDKELP